MFLLCICAYHHRNWPQAKILHLKPSISILSSLVRGVSNVLFWIHCCSKTKHLRRLVCGFEWLEILYNTRVKCTYRDLSRDDWIKEFIKRKWSSGLFWAVGAAEKKKLPTAISMQLLEVVFSTFCGQKNIFKFFQKYFSIRTKKLHNIKLSNIK